MSLVNTPAPPPLNISPGTINLGKVYPTRVTSHASRGAPEVADSWNFLRVPFTACLDSPQLRVFFYSKDERLGHS